MIDLNILQPLEIFLNGKKSMKKTLFVHSFSKCNQMFKNGSKESILLTNPPNLMRRVRISHKKEKMDKESENKSR